MNCVNNECWVEKSVKNSEMETAESDVVEISPDRRYLRYNEILGRGAFKNVYKGFDEVNGIEVAWNQVTLEDALQSPEHLERLYTEVHLLKTLKHENVIRAYASWVDDKSKTINMITELFTSGSLRQYRHKHKNIDMKAIKNWARQILRGLDYLHTHNPPVIHRDLKCDNIFVNGNHGEVKIGDLGLATIMQQPVATSVIGTPEFMAPELYDEEYNELVDIYSFGMCMLELVTCEYPYSECKNQAQIFKKVTSGIKPAAFHKVKDPEVRQFIEICLLPASQRLSAAELLKVTFLLSEYPKDYACDPPQLSAITPNSMNSLQSDSTFMDLDPFYKMISGSTCAESMLETCVSVLELHRYNEKNQFSLKGEKYDDDSISLTMRIGDYSGSVRNVHFIFYLSADTALSIASELVEALKLWKDDVAFIAELIDNVISQLIPCWRTMPGSLGGGAKRSTEGSATIHNETLIPNRDKEATNIKNNKNKGVAASSEHDVAMQKKDCRRGEKHGTSNGQQSLMIESVKNSGASYAGSWITASSDMSLSNSSLSLTEKDINENCDDLKLELDVIDLQYQQRCKELEKMRGAAIQNAKKKWIIKKITLL